MAKKNTICLWYDGTAADAARFYAATFPNSRVDAVHRAPGDYPNGKQGDVLMVEATVIGIPCVGLKGQVGRVLADHPARPYCRTLGPRSPQSRRPGGARDACMLHRLLQSVRRRSVVTDRS